ncbi:hypothetical protein Tco_1003968 [Tanacetum coccineum]|uniref:Uncharacterized protein n=1 Tax=Tanacetum coccineum TaxID=301880 RepID=A0ABQ5FBW9_9ASTR
MFITAIRDSSMASERAGPKDSLCGCVMSSFSEMLLQEAFEIVAHTLEVVPYPDTTPNRVVSIGAFIGFLVEGFRFKDKKKLLFIRGYFEAIAKKEHNISEKADTTLSLPSEEVLLVVEGPINASKDTILSSALNDAPLEVVFVGHDDEESTSGKTIVDEFVGIEQNEPVYFNMGK